MNYFHNENKPNYGISLVSHLLSHFSQGKAAAQGRIELRQEVSTCSEGSA